MTIIHMSWKKLELTAAGHANNAPKGQDIVCAGISAIVTTLGQYLLADEKWLRPEISLAPGNTMIRARPRIWKRKKAKEAYYQAILGLQLIAEQYPGNVLIEEE